MVTCTDVSFGPVSDDCALDESTLSLQTVSITSLKACPSQVQYLAFFICDVVELLFDSKLFVSKPYKVYRALITAKYTNHRTSKINHLIAIASP